MPVVPTSVITGADNSIDNVPSLTADELEQVRHKQEALDRLLETEGKAKYKIEIFFSHERKAHGLSAGMVSIWESGTKLHGGGDTKVYWCPAREKKISDCRGIIPDVSAGYGYLVCPQCKKVWKGEDVYGEIFYVLDAWKWAEVLLHHYASLNHNADLYAKYPVEDLRVAARLEQERQRGGEKLLRARTGRKQYIYTLRAIIKDVANGSDLLTRFHAFLTA